MGAHVCTVRASIPRVSAVQAGKRCRIEASASSANAATTATLEQFLVDAENLGTIRFINISDGGVLETIGRFDYSKKRIDVPNRGAFLTLANADKTFECHINISKVAKITLGKEKAKMGGHDLYVIRLKNEKDGIILSCLLMWDPSQGPGTYMHGAVSEFKRLEEKYGASFELKQ